MGGLFSTLNKKSLPDIYIDLENAQPKDEKESATYEAFRSEVIEPSISIFGRFSNYQDGQDLVAASFTNKESTEAKETAWEKISSNIQLQMEVYSFAATVADHFMRLINLVLESATSNDATDVFASMPTITKSFADCFDIILRFDEIKLTLPKLLNDLAFFRRSAQQYNEDGHLDELLEKSNLSTIFWASATPMLSETINQLSNSYPQDSPNFQKCLNLLGSISDVCTAIAKGSSDAAERPLLLCLRCIVGAVLMYDHLSPTGAFCNQAHFHCKEAMELLVNYKPQQTGLINAIKYSSKHIEDHNSNPKITALFQ